jgi:predicted metal-dependent phosphoesterase TrpH
MGYKYETHMHTSEGSACAYSTAEEMVRAHKELGYTGVFVTDHFFNGNTAVDRRLPWNEKVEAFCKGYENAKAEGDRIGLQVFFGFEYGVNAADFLVYNLDKEWLLNHPDIDKYDTRKAFRLMREEGAFIVHAHPFRERDYIPNIQLFPRDVDAVESFNGAQKDEPLVNERGKLYAMMYDLPQTAGSDSHVANKLFKSGVETEVKIEKPLDYFEMIKNGRLKFLEGNW